MDIRMDQSQIENRKSRITPARLLAAAITVFWAAMMTALVKREIAPAWSGAAPVSYEALLARNELARRSKMGIYFRRRRIGAVETDVQRARGRKIDISSRMTLAMGELNLPFVDALGPITIIFTARVDEDDGLRQFSIFVGHPLGIHIEGKVQGGRLRLVSELAGSSKEETSIPFDPHTIMSNALSPFLGVRNLRVGKEWRFAALDPLTRRVKMVRLKVTGRETLLLDGREFGVFVVEAAQGSLQFRSWITPEGEVVRQDTPYGISLRWEEAK